MLEGVPETISFRFGPSRHSWPRHCWWVHSYVTRPERRDGSTTVRNHGQTGTGRAETTGACFVGHHFPPDCASALRERRPGPRTEARTQFGEVYQTLQAFLGGAYVNQFNRFGR